MRQPSSAVGEVSRKVNRNGAKEIAGPVSGTAIWSRGLNSILTAGLEAADEPGDDYDEQHQTDDAATINGAAPIEAAATPEEKKDQENQEKRVHAKV